MRLHSIELVLSELDMRSVGPEEMKSLIVEVISILWSAIGTSDGEEHKSENVKTRN